MGLKLTTVKSRVMCSTSSQCPGIKSHIGLPALWGACFSLSLCLSLPLLVLSLFLSLSNK